MASISSLFAQTSSYETFVTQLVQIEAQKKLRYEVQQDDEKERKTAVGNVSKAITDLEAKITELSSTDNTPFQPFKSSTSDSSVIRVDDASGVTSSANFNVTIDRLAKNDVALDAVRTGANTDLAGLGDGEVTITIGDKTETISVVTTKDDGSGGTIDMTNEEVLEAFSAEISNLFGDEARASVFNTNGSDVQFSVQSLDTGFENRIQFSGATGFLSQVVGDVTKLTPEAELDAQFTIDGVTFERGSNTVDDAIDGLSFTLLDATGEQEQMSVTRDIEGAKSNVREFIKAFNEVNETIRERTFINPESGNKGPLQGYRSIRNLSTQLRQTALLSASSIPNGQVANFADFGISFEKDGEMKIDDNDLLEQILTERPEEIAAFFQDASSPIATIKAQAETYTEKGGILSALQDGFDFKIDRLDTLIKKEEDYLLDYETRQREIFNQLDAILEAGQAQFDQVVNFTLSSVQAPSYF